MFKSALFDLKYYKINCCLIVDFGSKLPNASCQIISTIQAFQQEYLAQLLFKQTMAIT